MTDVQRRPKVAILGSGVGAMTAAYELAVQDKYDITVYQMGWRLGGQGASGRNLSDHARIEEHGLHVWFGFYQNAFALMRRCYADLDRLPGAPLATAEQAFVGHDVFMFRETYEGRTHPWRIDFPANPDAFPGGDDHPSLPTLNHVFTQLLENAVGYFVTGLVNHMPLISDAHPLLSRLAAATPRFVHAGEAMSAEVARLLVNHAVEVVSRNTPGEWDTIAALLEGFRSFVSTMVRPVLRFDDPRRAFILIDTLLTIAIGILRDRVLSDGLDVINGKDFRAWLRDHGADPLASDSPLILALYDIFFAYEGGDTSRPSVEAGLALRGCLRTMLTYHGHVLWKMNAGMGDTIFAPFYLALKARGVTFKFFHRVARLTYDTDRGLIDTIEIARQVDLTVPEYDPLVDVDGLPCWPNAPRLEQVANPDSLSGVNLESRWSGWPDVGRVTLRAGEDYDHIVLGITVAGLPDISDDKLMALPHWRQMLEQVKTVRTQAVQLWFTRTSAELGMPVEGGIIADCTEPDACWADFIQVLGRERWGSDGAKALFYGCGVLSDDGVEMPAPDDTAFPAQQLARVREATVAFLNTSGGQVWPFGTTQDGFDWNSLYTAGTQQGEARLDGQYLRANVDPSERYVLSLAGSTQFRLKTDGTGIGNLFLAGSWIDNGFNLSCVEAAVMSGMQASRAISGSPAVVVGEHGFPRVSL